MSYATIEYEIRGRVALITLNRPDRLNAWTPQMAAEQAAAINAANDDADIGAIVMTGAGRGFCAGADIGAIVMTGAGRGFCAGADMEATFGKRLDGVDQGGTTAQGSGGMPAEV